MVEQLAREFILESTMEETSDQRFGYSVIHSYLREKSYPVTKDNKHGIRKYSQHFACEMKSYSNIYYIGGVSSKFTEASRAMN